MGRFLSRRRLLATAGSCGVLGVTGAVVAGQAPVGPPPALFSGGSFTLAAPGTIEPTSFSANISDDGAAVTVLFDSLKIDLGAEKDPFSIARVACLQVPFKVPPDRRVAGFSSHVGGFVEKTKGAIVSLQVSLGGKSESFEYEEGKEVGKPDFLHSVFALRRRDLAVDMPPPDPIPLYVAQFVLSGQRSKPDDVLHLHVDSLDIEVSFFN
jgi:hypothetical protein